MKHDKPTNDQSLTGIFSHATARPQPPEQDKEAVYAELHQQWAGMVHHRKRKKWFATGIGIAASLLVTVLLVRNQLSPSSTDSTALAQVARQSGQVIMEPVSGVHGSVTGGDLVAGQTISTGAESWLAIDWHTGVSIRLGENSRISLLSSDQIDLISGQVYIDTRQGQDSDLLVQTPAGAIRHLGTQYLAILTTTGVDVAVREGQVQVSLVEGNSLARAGELLSIDSAGQARVQAVDSFGGIWAWTEETTAPFELDGLSIYEFLEKVGHETGRHIEFDDQETERIARRETLRGSVNLSPVDALQTVLMTTDLQALVNNGQILVSAR